MQRTQTKGKSRGLALENTADPLLAGETLLVVSKTGGKEAKKTFVEDRREGRFFEGKEGGGRRRL